MCLRHSGNYRNDAVSNSPSFLIVHGCIFKHNSVSVINPQRGCCASAAITAPAAEGGGEMKCEPGSICIKHEL